MTATRNRLKEFKEKYFLIHSHIAPLAVFRIAFGAVMLISVIRFILNGWVKEFYISPDFHFSFYGFHWVKPLGEIGMYLVFAIMVLASLLIMVGLFYRISIITFFICFTYVELIDSTYYLNHYYFISIMSFMLIFLPAHRYFSLDCVKNSSLRITHIPAWCITVIKLQLASVYFFAGIAKINSDWLLHAMPLKIGLPPHAYLPVIGTLLDEVWVAYLFSWFGMVYDLTIAFLLFNASTQRIAYFFVVVFHLFTAWFFSIGMFPYIMILLTIIFFSEYFHKKVLRLLSKFFRRDESELSEKILPAPNVPFLKTRFLILLFGCYFLVQIILPFRYLFYPGNLFWTEEGYRFSWRVMLMEKAGTTFFYITEPSTGRKFEVDNSKFLTPLQEQMMSTQPDMILQYAHILQEEYKKQGIKDPEVRVESYVTLNGSGSRSRLFVDTTVDLSKEKESLGAKTWILPFKKN
ncbi:MAG: HTTM domain-containing protein [Cytophagaceae bacterium]|nr:HTTM domain-containing protein [Cytophagaceae bacterium]